MKLIFNLNSTHEDQSYFDLKSVPFIVGQKVRFSKEYHKEFKPNHRVDKIIKLSMNLNSFHQPPNIIAHLDKAGHSMDLSWLKRIDTYKKL